MSLTLKIKTGGSLYKFTLRNCDKRRPISVDIDLNDVKSETESKSDTVERTGSAGLDESARRTEQISHRGPENVVVGLLRPSDLAQLFTVATNPANPANPATTAVQASQVNPSNPVNPVNPVNPANPANLANPSNPSAATTTEHKRVLAMYNLNRGNNLRSQSDFIPYMNFITESMSRHSATTSSETLAKHYDLLVSLDIWILGAMNSTNSTTSELAKHLDISFGKNLIKTLKRITNEQFAQLIAALNEQLPIETPRFTNMREQLKVIVPGIRENRLDHIVDVGNIYRCNCELCID